MNSYLIAPELHQEREVIMIWRGGGPPPVKYLRPLAKRNFGMKPAPMVVKILFAERCNEIKCYAGNYFGRRQGIASERGHK